ncbi:MAG: hypothetical protein WAV90_15850 [Gordonia amarae]
MSERLLSEYLTATTVAKKLGVDRRIICAHVKDHPEIPTIKIGTQFRYHVPSVLDSLRVDRA